MPYGDGTGPWRTRGNWFCRRGFGVGRGMGRGFGRGFGRGMGRGFGRMSFYQDSPVQEIPQPTKDEEMQELRTYTEELKTELEEIKKRMNELKKK